MNKKNLIIEFARNLTILLFIFVLFYLFLGFFFVNNGFTGMIRNVTPPAFEFQKKEPRNRAQIEASLQVDQIKNNIPSFEQLNHSTTEEYSKGHNGPIRPDDYAHQYTLINTYYFGLNGDFGKSVTKLENLLLETGWQVPYQEYDLKMNNEFQKTRLYALTYSPDTNELLLASRIIFPRYINGKNILKLSVFEPGDEAVKRYANEYKYLFAITISKVYFSN